MKKILTLFFTVSLLGLNLVSCGTIPQYTMTNVIDYSEFTKNGIFVTEANAVSFDYQPVGSIFSVSQGEVKGLFARNIDTDQVFKEVTEKLKSLDANGLINLRISSLEASSSSIKLYVSGMAIRTKEPIVDAKSIVLYNEPKTDIHIDGIHCFIIKQFSAGVAIMTEQKLSLEQIRKAAHEFNIKGKELQFFLPNTKDSYFGVTNNGFIINYETNEFIPLK